MIRRDVRSGPIDRAHVLGVSMGGMIAQEVALRHPRRVGTLTLVCTYPAPSAEERTVRTQTLAAFGVNGSLAKEAAPAQRRSRTTAILTITDPREPG